MLRMDIPLIHAMSRRNRILLRELIITDFKLRYQGSVLGYLWSLLKPLMLFSILYVVFGHFLRIGADVEHFPIYLLLGVVLWGFFAEATTNGLISIVARGDLIRKISFPKYIIVISGTISALINLCFNLVIVFIFMAFAGVKLHASALLFPLAVIEIYILALALAFFLSATYVKYRDIGHIWEVVLQGAFYATPILYPVSLVAAQSETAAKILLLSPVAQAIQDARYTLITHQADTLYSMVQNPLFIAIPFISVVLISLMAYLYFRKNANYFAENI